MAGRCLGETKKRQGLLPDHPIISLPRNDLSHLMELFFMFHPETVPGVLVADYHQFAGLYARLDPLPYCLEIN